jgi:hypothetical protein
MYGERVMISQPKFMSNGFVKWPNVKFNKTIPVPLSEIEIYNENYAISLKRQRLYNDNDNEYDI